MSNTTKIDPHQDTLWRYFRSNISREETEDSVIFQRGEEKINHIQSNRKSSTATQEFRKKWSNAFKILKENDF